MLVGGGLGIIAGIGAAIAIDVNYLARTTEEVAGNPALIEYGSLTANPGLGLTERGSMTFGFNGRF